MSNLLEQASLVMIPSGYKEDVVYSEIPLDGSGDLQLTRASNGTRVNSAGLVEVCPWNLALYSEDFSNGVWTTTSTTITADNTTAPNGTATADKVEISSSSNARVQQIINSNSITGGLPCTFSVYIKSVSGTGNVGIRSGQTGLSSVFSYTNQWQRFIWTFNAYALSEIMQFCNNTLVGGADSAPTFYVWGAQLNIGSTAKPYFPTTDRLNVPRLTYQNGGGGCPSLLLEKQSTNLVTYSEQFDNAAWAKLDSGSGSTTPVVTANYATSPDGTQNADRLQCTIGSSGYSLIQQSPTQSGTHTGSIWVKSNTGANQNIYFRIATNITAYVVTPQWQRITITESAGDYLTIGLRDQTGYTNYSCDILIWGAQVEASSYATSYIPTTSSSATRVADAFALKDITSFSIGNAYTILLDVTMQSSDNNKLFFETRTSTNATSLTARNFNGALRLFNNIDASYPLAAVSSSTNKWVVRINGTSYDLFAVSGGIATKDSATITTARNFGYFELAGSTTQLYFDELVIFPTALTDAECQSLVL